MNAETLVLLLFCLILVSSLLLNIPLVAALFAGLCLFFGYGRFRSLSWRELGKMALSGVWQARKILLLFFLIGMLSAVWRCSGTIASLVCYCGALIHPAAFLLAAFLLNAMVSFLTGTSFGTSATMGVICMTMGKAVGIPVAATGGAILSGAFFGDRCSPVSSSALLVADITKTDIYHNMRLMMKTGMVPVLLTCAIYLVVGLLLPHSGTLPDMRSLFEQEFVIHPLTLLPAALILLLSLLRIDVRITLAVDIAVTVPLCLLMQHTPASTLLEYIVHGFTAANADITPILNGGGILSMVRVAAIICISSAYSGIFREMGLLDQIRGSIDALVKRSTSFAAMLLTSIASAAISCNQTLTIMLVNQLCEGCEPDNQTRAVHLENTAVVIAPLIPWSIAGSVPLAAVGAPAVSILAAVYLYLIPLWQLFCSMYKGGTSSCS